VVTLSVGFEFGRGHDAPVSTATTPVGELSWRTVSPPSGAFRVSLPAKPETTTVQSPAGAGQQVEARVNQTTVAVAAFAGGSQAQALVEPIIQHRANALDGYVDSIRTVGSRSGEAFEGVVYTTVAVAIVRVIVNGPMIYILEMRGDIDSPRAHQIYDQVVLTFTPR
jgi:hypothetical protein